MRISEIIYFAKKILWFLAFFVLFTLLINTLFLVLIASTDWDFLKRRESLTFDNPDFELLVLGTSLAEYGIDTQYLTRSGIKSYNMAFVGSSIRTSFIQLDEYISNFPNRPQFVLLGMNSYLERFGSNGIQPVVEFTMKGHRYGAKDLPISKFNWAGLELIKRLLRRSYRETYVSLGQKKCAYYEPDLSVWKENELNLQEYETAKWISEISGLCADNGMKLILIEMPGVRETQNASQVGPYKIKYDKGGEALLFNFNNKEFCDFINNETDWAGLSHFNKFGAEKFTSELLVRVFYRESGQVDKL